MPVADGFGGLSADAKGRLIQSLKSFLTSRMLQGTEVFGRRYTLEDLIASPRRRIAIAFTRQDPNGSKLGLHQVRALASSVRIESKRRAGHSKGRSRAVA